jgi:TPR repeat protein
VLESRGLRITPNREFFQATPTDAIDALLLVLRDIDRATGNVSSPQSEQNADEAERLREAAWAVAVGADDTLLDIPEAIRLYKLAIAHGSRQADLELGRIYAHQSGLLIVNLALIHLKRTAEANVPRAWAILADAFGRSGSI